MAPRARLRPISAMPHCPVMANSVAKPALYGERGRQHAQPVGGAAA